MLLHSSIILNWKARDNFAKKKTNFLNLMKLIRVENLPQKVNHLSRVKEL